MPIPKLPPALLAAHVFAVTACGNAVAPDDPTDIGSWMEAHEVPGVSVVVFRDFAIHYVEAHGVKSRATGEPVTEETLFQAASLTKGVSAMGVLSLAQDGVVDLDTDVNTYLTSWQVPDNAYQATEKVTLRRLLSHTAGTTVSGFRGYRDSELLPTTIQILNGEYPANSAPVVVNWVPGSEFHYSGGGFVIIDQVVKDVTGMPFSTVIRERVLEPLGMDHSTYEQPLPDSLRDRAASGYYANGVAVPGGHHIYPEIAAAALWTTPSDVARFLIELQLSLRNESNRVLTQENAELLLRNVARDYGLGFNLWTIRRQPYFGHFGANDGFRGRMLAHRTTGYGMVILTNSDRGFELAEAALRVIGERENWPGF